MGERKGQLLNEAEKFVAPENKMPLFSNQRTAKATEKKKKKQPALFFFFAPEKTDKAKCVFEKGVGEGAEGGPTSAALFVGVEIGDPSSLVT